MKKECSVCGKSLGMVSVKYPIKDGDVVCSDCLPKLGYTQKDANMKFLTKFQQVSADDVVRAAAGDADALERISDIVEQKDESKQDREIRKFMERYQLEDLDEKDLVVLRKIATDLAGNGLMKTGMALSFANAGEQLKVTYLSALVEQNWMIIRQLSRMNNALDAISKK